jgi:hypothetical protein
MLFLNIFFRLPLFGQVAQMLNRHYKPHYEIVDESDLETDCEDEKSRSSDAGCKSESDEVTAPIRQSRAASVRDTIKNRETRAAIDSEDTLP